MKSYIKIGLVIVAVLGLIILFTDYIRNKDEYKDLKKALKEKEQQVKIVSDNNIQLKDRVVSFEASEIVYKREKDSIAKLLKVKPKTIKEIVTVQSEVEANLEPRVDTFTNSETKMIDSLKLSYKDEWIELDGVVTPKGSRVRITGEDSLLITHLSNGKVDIRNSNKYIKLRGASSLTIAPKEEATVQVRPFIGVAYVPIKRSIEPVVGIGVTVNVGKVLKTIF